MTTSLPVMARRMGMPFEWDCSGNTRIKLVNLDKSDFSARFDIILEYPPNLFGGERTAGAQASGI